ncbi:hypothetical protein [Endozoicomonas sp. SCSIO W0465]|uniref:hypothetical protein n=1 Tax=Endozoicomonas sp. SCSIO W0465 TaxID=2918516 RepID=UPI0020750F8F|nr:hypothetical protein [Endozoicomonas sp. SCSIO W0465]USE34786.1 hypothetical protein MJO57_22040 [Endozoicomonas sp. SCSIO W0465]
MSLRLPYFGEHNTGKSASKRKEARSRSSQYFGGYPVSIIDSELTNALVIERKHHICTFCNGVLRSAVQLIPCGHRSCKNCHDLRILISKEKVKNPEETFCRSCLELDKATQQLKPENSKRCLFTYSYEERFFEKHEAREIFIKHCPVDKCKTWTGRTLQALYKHEKDNHGDLEQQTSPLSDADIHQFPLNFKALNLLSETAHSSKKKRKKHKKPKNLSDQLMVDSKATRQEAALATATTEAKRNETANQPAGPAAACSSALSFIQSLAMGHRPYHVPPEILQLRTHFRSEITDAVKHQPEPVIFIGSMAFHMHVKYLWGEDALTHITPETMPDGISEELIKLSLEPRDIDLSVPHFISLEAAKDRAVKWMMQAVSKHPYPQAKVLKTENLQLHSPDHFTTASILYLKDGIPRPQNILFAIDITQKTESTDNAPQDAPQDAPEMTKKIAQPMAKEIEPHIYAKCLSHIITDETRCITSLCGGQTRALKAVIRLCSLAILDTMQPGLDMPTRALLADALRQIPGQDQCIFQLTNKLSESNGDQFQFLPAFLEATDS